MQGHEISQPRFVITICNFCFRIDESLCQVDSEDDGVSQLDDSLLTTGGHPGERCETRATVEG